MFGACPARSTGVPRAGGRAELARFTDVLGFELDPFQVEACEALEQGHGVLVAAPTGAGKTVVGEFAVHLALTSGRKAFYTTPIKALSNQKYNDLVARHGAASVGLLTGDTSLNGEAPVVVMTTEVLRNMLYAGSSTLSGLAFVVMDEVHYLADRFRGPVWEEVIIHLPEHVQLASLSATVSNAEEFGAWLDTVRGDTRVVVSEHRPVPLWQHVVTGDEGAAAPGCSTCSSRTRRAARWSTPSCAGCSARSSRSAAATSGTGGVPHGRGGDRGGCPAATAAATAAVTAAATAASGTTAASAGPRARRSSSGWTPRACCRRSPSSSAGPGATPPSGSAWCPASG